MKQIGILTLDPYSYNYGGFLQEMALQDAVNSLGMYCEIINYRPQSEYNTFSAKKNIKYLTFSKIVGKARSVLGHGAVTEETQRSINQRKTAFDQCRSEHIRLSEAVSYRQLYSKQLPYDTIVCGSDQIWNPDFNIPSFFLGFARPDQQKVIYAASIGKETLTRMQKEAYRKLLEGLDHISVREMSAQGLIAPLTKQPVELVLDPTMLHDRSYWEKKAAGSQKEYQGYVFCYFLGLTEEKVAAARAYADSHNSKIVAIPCLHGHGDPLHDKLADISDAAVNPVDFLKLIRDARCVLTDSFHAVVFSLIFQKEFWAFERKVGNYDMNTRLDTLLSYFHAEKRMVRPMDLENQEELGAVAPGEMFEQMKDYSWRFLNEALQ